MRTHPVSGRKALYVNDGFTQRFADMTVAESRPLLDYLIRHASQPALTVRHRWREGDVVMWDNRCVMHSAIHDYADDPREMHRVTVRGERRRDDHDPDRFDIGRSEGQPLSFAAGIHHCLGANLARAPRLEKCSAP